MRIWGFQNWDYFCPANNPHGHQYWYATRRARNAALAAFIAKAEDRHGFTPDCRRIVYRIRRDSQASLDFYHRLTEQPEGVTIYANGIDWPEGEASVSWGEEFGV